MKALYVLTLMVSLLITLAVAIVCMPLVLIGALGSWVMNKNTDWLNHLTDTINER